MDEVIKLIKAYGQACISYDRCETQSQPNMLHLEKARIELRHAYAELVKYCATTMQKEGRTDC